MTIQGGNDNRLYARQVFDIYDSKMHQPVLLQEVLYYLDPKPNENFIDATFGFGGHSCAILERTGPNGKLLGIELDSEVCQQFKEEVATMPDSLFSIPERFVLVNDSYVHLGRITTKYNVSPIHGILFDLGFSSWHIEKSDRGFSFLRDGPLNMRYILNGGKQNTGLPPFAEPALSEANVLRVNYPRNDTDSLTAEWIINIWPREELTRIFKEYGEERFASRIAQEVIAARKKQPIKTTFQLVEIIRRAIPGKFQHQKIHPATRVFQALRIAVNDELNHLKSGLAQTLKVLAPGGRLVVISFHSGEDRIVKNFFREQKQKGILKILTKKPVRPTAAEIKNNPRSRSAKLRAAKINF